MARRMGLASAGGDKMMEVRAVSHLACARMSAGDVAGAVELRRQELRLLQEFFDPVCTYETQWRLGAAPLKVGRAAEAGLAGRRRRRLSSRRRWGCASRYKRTWTRT